MKKCLVVLCLLAGTCYSAMGEDRFGRPVVKVQDPKLYQFVKLDDVNYPTLNDAKFDVTCLVYRGTHHYYVEIGIKNKTAAPVIFKPDSVIFNKPGYSVFQTDPLIAAREAGMVAGMPFIPTPPTYVPPTTHTTINATASTYGNQTYVNGTATTTTDNSGQVGANLGNAIGNAFAARAYQKHQRAESMLASFISTHLVSATGEAIAPGQVRTFIFTFDQVKAKKAPFDVSLQLDGATEKFSFKE